MEEMKVTFYSEDSEPVNLKCEVAKSFFAKMKGMMYRESLQEERGMIFPFLVPWYKSFWMKNVKIPLDIIFVNRRYEIIAIYEASIETGFFL